MTKIGQVEVLFRSNCQHSVRSYIELFAYIIIITLRCFVTDVKIEVIITNDNYSKHNIDRLCTGCELQCHFHIMNHYSVMDKSVRLKYM